MQTSLTSSDPYVAITFFIFTSFVPRALMNIFTKYEDHRSFRLGGVAFCVKNVKIMIFALVTSNDVLIKKPEYYTCAWS